MITSASLRQALLTRPSKFYGRGKWKKTVAQPKRKQKRRKTSKGDSKMVLSAGPTERRAHGARASTGTPAKSAARPGRLKPAPFIQEIMPSNPRWEMCFPKHGSFAQEGLGWDSTPSSQGPCTTGSQRHWSEQDWRPHSGYSYHQVFPALRIIWG